MKGNSRKREDFARKGNRPLIDMKIEYSAQSADII